MGYFFTPTVLTDVGPDMRVMNEEPFGPIAPITTFAGFDEAIALGNATPYGLGGFVFTEDLTTAFRAVRGTRGGDGRGQPPHHRHC